MFPIYCGDCSYFCQLALWKLLPNPSPATKISCQCYHLTDPLYFRLAARPAWCWVWAPAWAASVTACPRPAPPSTAPPPAPRPSTDPPRGPAPPPGWAPPPPATTSWWPWPTLQVSKVLVWRRFLIEALMRGCILNVSFFFFVALMPTFLYFLSTCKSLNSSNSGIEIYFSHLLLTTKDKYLLSWKLVKDVRFWIDLSTHST